MIRIPAGLYFFISFLAGLFFWYGVFNPSPAMRLYMTVVSFSVIVLSVRGMIRSEKAGFKYCAKCRRGISSLADFCVNCGGKLPESDTAPLRKHVDFEKLLIKESGGLLCSDDYHAKLALCKYGYCLHCGNRIKEV